MDRQQPQASSGISRRTMLKAAGIGGMVALSAAGQVLAVELPLEPVPLARNAF